MLLWTELCASTSCTTSQLRTIKGLIPATAISTWFSANSSTWVIIDLSMRIDWLSVSMGSIFHFPKPYGVILALITHECVSSSVASLRCMNFGQGISSSSSSTSSALMQVASSKSFSWPSSTQQSTSQMYGMLQRPTAICFFCCRLMSKMKKLYNVETRTWSSAM